MIVKGTVVGRDVRTTKKGTQIATYCIEVDECSKTFEGNNVYRYDMFNPRKIFETGEVLNVALDTFQTKVTDIGSAEE